MTPRLVHYHNTLVKKIGILYRMSKCSDAKVLTLERLYNDIVKLYQTVTPDIALNQWLDGKISIDTDSLEIAGSKSYAESRLEASIEMINHFGLEKFNRVMNIPVQSACRC